MVWFGEVTGPLRGTVVSEEAQSWGGLWWFTASLNPTLPPLFLCFMPVPTDVISQFLMPANLLPCLPHHHGLSLWNCKPKVTFLCKCFWSWCFYPRDREAANADVHLVSGLAAVCRGSHSQCCFNTYRKSSRVLLYYLPCFGGP